MTTPSALMVAHGGLGDGGEAAHETFVLPIVTLLPLCSEYVVRRYDAVLLPGWYTPLVVYSA